MRLDNSPEPLWLPRQVPMRVPENSALLLFGRGSRFGEWLSLGTPTGRHRALRKTSARFARRMFRRSSSAVATSREGQRARYSTHWGSRSLPQKRDRCSV